MAVERVCSFTGCERPHYARGLCTMHYQRMMPRARKDRGPCAVDGCINRRNGSTYCKAHEDQLKAGKELGPLQQRNYVVDGMKLCNDCGRVLPVSEFNKHGKSVHPKCKDCKSIANRLHLYGVSAAAVVEMMARPCDCCGGEPPRNRKHIDHDHNTGKVRGVLCHNCNISLGLMNEDPARLRALAEYIERHR